MDSMRNYQFEEEYHGSPVERPAGIRMPDHTLEQVSKTFGVTRERIRQIEAKALQKLSRPGMARKLLTFTQS